MLVVSMSYSNLKEYYEDVQRLIQHLRLESFDQEAEELATLMGTAWTTGSELLGSLSIALGQFKGRYPTETKDWLRRCENFAANHRAILGLGDE